MFATVLILLADDDEAQRVAEALGQVGFDPHVASTSGLSDLVVDAVVVDAARRMELELLGTVPVLGLDTPGDERLDSPFTRQQLTGAIARLVGVKSPVLTLGDRRVDLHQRVVHTPDGETSLTAREAELLGYLAEHPHRVVPSDEIVGAVWGRAGASTLSVTLRRIRQKIEADPAHPVHLKTVHSVGVQLLLPKPGARRTTPPPRPASPLIGRDALVDEVLGLLASGERALALVGPPGVGKGRVALEVAHRTETPVVWGAIEGVDSAVDAVRAALDLPAPEGTADQQVRAALIDAGALVLVMDDADRVELSAVFSWLEHAPELQVLVTSRTAVPQARRVAVDPLDVADAVTLLEREARGEPGLAEVAQALDGLPLALEVAAPMVGLLGAQRVVARMAGAGPLEDAIAASWAALDEPNRHALARLACLSRPFPVEAAEAVLGDLQPLQQLVGASLVQSRGRGTFELLRSIRSFAATTGDPATCLEGRRALRRWLVDHLNDAPVDEVGAWIGLILDAHADAIADLDADGALALLHVAHNWLGQRGRRGAYTTALDASLALGGSPTKRVEALLHRGTLALPDPSAARPYFTEALQIAEDIGDAEAKAQALARIGETALYGGDGAAAIGHYAEALAHCRRHRPLRQEGMVRMGHAHALLASGRTEEMEAACLEALDVLHRDDAPMYRVNVLVLLGTLLERTGRGPEADRVTSEALAIARERGDVAAVGRFLSNIGAGYVGRGRTAPARAALDEALELRLAIGHPLGVARARGNLATLHVITGDVAAALDQITQARQTLERLGDRHSEALCRVVLGEIRLQEGRWAEARHLLQSAHDDLQILGDGAGTASADRLLAWLDTLDGDADAAAERIARAAATLDELRALPKRALLEDLALMVDADRGLDVSGRATAWADRAQAADLVGAEVRLRALATGALAASGRPDDAETVLARAQALLGEMDDPVAAERVRYAAAEVAIGRGDREPALQALGTPEPTHPELRLARGILARRNL